jgi:hypothetical protein
MVSMDAYFHGGLNETIRNRVRPRLLEISPFWFKVVLTASGCPDVIKTVACKCSQIGLGQGF